MEIPCTRFSLSVGTMAAIMLVCIAITVVSQPELGGQPGPSGQPGPGPSGEPELINRRVVVLNLAAGSYQEFFDAMHNMVEKECQIDKTNGHFTLQYPTGMMKPPRHWIVVSVYDGEVFKTELHFRDDTLYMLLFVNKDFQMFHFKGYEEWYKGEEDIFALSFKETYGELTERAGDEYASDILPTVFLGQEPARQAANILSNYDRKKTPVTVVKRALLTFCIMIGEALRFKPIGRRCIDHWKECTWLTPLEANYTGVWSKMSELFITKDINGPVTKYEKKMRESCQVTMIRELDPILDFVMPHKEMQTGNLVGCAFGANFKPHIIHVAAAEDVNTKIMSFSQQGPRAICILSASGVISNVKLRQPDSLGDTVTYKGRFELLSLSGSFTPMNSGGTRNRSGGMNVTLAASHGRVIGGGVAGPLVAAAPVQVVVGRLSCGGSPTGGASPSPS